MTENTASLAICSVLSPSKQDAIATRSEITAPGALDRDRVCWRSAMAAGHSRLFRRRAILWAATAASSIDTAGRSKAPAPCTAGAAGSACCFGDLTDAFRGAGAFGFRAGAGGLSLTYRLVGFLSAAAGAG